jgi:hypothetical protein
VVVLVKEEQATGVLRFTQNDVIFRATVTVILLQAEKRISPLRCASVEMTIQWICERRTGNGKGEMRDPSPFDKVRVTTKDRSKNKDNSRSLRDDKQKSDQRQNKKRTSAAKQKKEHRRR